MKLRRMRWRGGFLLFLWNIESDEMNEIEIAGVILFLTSLLHFSTHVRCSHTSQSTY